MKLFYYEHCPYCIRVLMLISYKKIEIEHTVLLNDNEKTPISLIGKKMLPILEKDTGEHLADSLDIIQYLDQLDKPILSELTYPGFLTDWLDRTKSLWRELTYPRMIQHPFREFQTQSAKDYFENKKLKSAGNFSELLEQTETKKNALQPLLEELEKLIPELTGEDLTWEDIFLFPFLRLFTLVPGINWPPAVKKYLELKSKLLQLPLYTNS